MNFSRRWPLHHLDQRVDGASQQQQGQQRQQQGHDAVRDAATTAWDRHKGKVVSTSAGITDYRKTDEAISKELMETTRSDMEEMKKQKVQGAPGIMREWGRGNH